MSSVFDCAVSRPAAATVNRAGENALDIRFMIVTILVSLHSKATRAGPKAFHPRLPRRNALELLINAFLGEVQSVGDARHRFEADEITILAGRGAGRRRVNHGGAILGA